MSEQQGSVREHPLQSNGGCALWLELTLWPYNKKDNNNINISDTESHGKTSELYCRRHID